MFTSSAISVYGFTESGIPECEVDSTGIVAQLAVMVLVELVVTRVRRFVWVFC